MRPYGDERIRYYWQPNQGVAQTYNRLMELARGEYFHHLDNDDVLVPGALSRKSRRLTRIRRAALVYGEAPSSTPARRGRATGGRRAAGANGPDPLEAAFKALLRGCHITTSRVMMRRQRAGPRASRSSRRPYPARTGTSGCGWPPSSTWPTRGTDRLLPRARQQHHRRLQRGEGAGLARFTLGRHLRPTRSSATRTCAATPTPAWSGRWRWWRRGGGAAGQVGGAPAAGGAPRPRLVLGAARPWAVTYEGLKTLLPANAGRRGANVMRGGMRAG